MSRELTIYDHGKMDEHGRVDKGNGNYVYAVRDIAGYRKMLDNVRTAYLGPWCPDCGKKGTKCRNREVCRRRAITSVKSAKFVSLGYYGGGGYRGPSRMDIQAKAYAECVKRGDVAVEAVAA